MTTYTLQSFTVPSPRVFIQQCLPFKQLVCCWGSQSTENTLSGSVLPLPGFCQLQEHWLDSFIRNNTLCSIACCRCHSFNREIWLSALIINTIINTTQHTVIAFSPVININNKRSYPRSVNTCAKLFTYYYFVPSRRLSFHFSATTLRRRN